MTKNIATTHTKAREVSELIKPVDLSHWDYLKIMMIYAIAPNNLGEM